MKFLELFHRELPKGELLRQFFSMSPEPQETVAQFTIQFHDLYRQLAQDVFEHHIPDTFLASLREPLRMTLALTDLSNQTIEQIIARVLAIDRTHIAQLFRWDLYKAPFHHRRTTTSDKPSNVRPTQALPSSP